MIYEIPIIYQRIEKFNVEANSLHDACVKALKEFLSTPDDNYLQDSFELDNILEDNYPDEPFDIIQIYNDI